MTRMRFLIVKTSSIGDVIQSFPLIDLLKKEHPECQIDWVAERGCASLLEAHPDIHRVIIIDTKKWRKTPFSYRSEIADVIRELRKVCYDALFDVQGNTKSGGVNLFARAKAKVGYSWGSLPEKPNYLTTNTRVAVEPRGNVRTRYLQLVGNYLGAEPVRPKRAAVLQLTPKEEIHLERLKQQGAARPRLMICFGSNWKNKQLTEETLVEFLRLVQEKLFCHYFFVYGNEEEKQVTDRLERQFSPYGQTAGGMSLPLWQRFMQEVEGVIAMDSAALHLSGTTETPSFSLFGPSSALVYKPLGDHHHAFQGACPYDVTFEKRCPKLRTCPTGSCLRDLSPNDLADEFYKFWMSRSKSTALSTS